MRHLILLVGGAAIIMVAVFACSSFGSSDEGASVTPSEAGTRDGDGTTTDGGAPEAASANDGSTSTLGVGLVARWRFDEGTGTVAKNDVVTAPTGALSNATWDVGQLGNAVRFDRDAGSLVTVQPSPTLDLQTAVSISVWCKLGDSASTNDQRFVRRDPIDFKLNGRQPQLGVRGAVTTTLAKSGYDLPLDEWHHITATYDGVAAHIYADGIETALALNSLDGTPLPPQNGPLFIGGFGELDNGTANGLLDDVRVWNRALTPIEVAELYKER